MPHPWTSWIGSSLGHGKVPLPVAKWMNFEIPTIPGFCGCALQGSSRDLSTGSPGFPKNCSWSDVEQLGGSKENRAPKSLELGEWPLDLAGWRRQQRQHPHLVTAWRDSELPTWNTLGADAVIPLFFLAGSGPQRSHSHPITTLWLRGTLPRHLLLLSTPTSPTPALQPILTPGGLPNPPHFAHRSHRVSCQNPERFPVGFGPCLSPWDTAGRRGLG